MNILLYRERNRSYIEMQASGRVTLSLDDESPRRKRGATVNWSAIGSVDAATTRAVADALTMASIIAARFDAGATADEALTGFTVVDVYAEAQAS